MSKKKPAMVITIECENKEEVKNVLNLFKDALAAHLPELMEDDSDESEPQAFQPKEGDICTCVVDDNIDAIFRYSGKKRTDEDGDVWFEGNPGLTCSEDLFKPYMIIYGEDAEYLSGCCRLATEEEIKLFHEKTKALKNEQNKWSIGDWVYAVGCDSGCSKVFYSVPITYAETKTMENLVKRGWVFDKESDCNALCDKLNEAIKNVKP